MEYKVKKLIEAKYDFSQVKPEKQALLKEKEGFNFNLADVVELLRSETNQFTVKNPVAQALDTEIYAMICEFHHAKGEDLDICKFDDVVEVKPEPKPEPKPEVVDERWDFIEKYLPDYVRNDDVLFSDILTRVVNGEEVDAADVKMLMDEYEIDIHTEAGKAKAKELLEQVDSELYAKAKAAKEANESVDEEAVMKAEWKDALEGLTELLAMGDDAGSKEEIAEWKEAVEGLQELLS